MRTKAKLERLRFPNKVSTNKGTAERQQVHLSNNEMLIVEWAIIEALQLRIGRDYRFKLLDLIEHFGKEYIVVDRFIESNTHSTEGDIEIIYTLLKVEYPNELKELVVDVAQLTKKAAEYTKRLRSLVGELEYAGIDLGGFNEFILGRGIEHQS